MCGRYVRRSDKQRLAEHFRLRDAAVEVFPSYNIAPTTFQPVIRLDDESGDRTIVAMRWGLIPPWTSDVKKLGVSTINAKAETVLDKPLWRDPFRKRRCLVPADAFYEWQKLDAKTKQPWAFAMRDGEPFAFAGLWERRRAADGLPLESFAILTTQANEIMAPVHVRMPVIIQPADYQRWLGLSDEKLAPLDLLRPYDPARMKTWKAAQEVGNARNDSPGLCGDW